MKKLLLTLVIVLAVSLTAASLTLADEAPASANTAIQRAFLDADGDGVCDNSGVMRARKGYTANANQTATGAYSPGPNFVDEDGDGVCDNCDGTPNLYRYSYGSQNQDGAMNGPGPNFVDEDGDGICDNCALHQYDYDHEYQSPGPHGRMNGNRQGTNAGNP